MRPKPEWEFKRVQVNRSCCRSRFRTSFTPARTALDIHWGMKPEPQPGRVILSLSLSAVPSSRVSQCKRTKTQARISGGVARKLNLRHPSSPLNCTRTDLLVREAFNETRTCSLAYRLATPYNQQSDCKRSAEKLGQNNWGIALTQTQTQTHSHHRRLPFLNLLLSLSLPLPPSFPLAFSLSPSLSLALSASLDLSHFA